MDTDGNGDVSLEEFTAYLSATSLNNANITKYGDVDDDVSGVSGRPRAKAAGISRAAAVPIAADAARSRCWWPGTCMVKRSEIGEFGGA